MNGIRMNVCVCICVWERVCMDFCEVTTVFRIMLRRPKRNSFSVGNLALGSCNREECV